MLRTTGRLAGTNALIKLELITIQLITKPLASETMSYLTIIISYKIMAASRQSVPW